MLDPTRLDKKVKDTGKCVSQNLCGKLGLA